MDAFSLRPAVSSQTKTSNYSRRRAMFENEIQISVPPKVVADNLPQDPANKS